MKCYVHSTTEAIGVCSVCGRGVCQDCLAASSPRMVCVDCKRAGRVLYGYEYKSKRTLMGFPLLHVAAGIDPLTGRPKIAKGIVAVGSVAFGLFSLGGIAIGLLALGGLSVGVLFALGGLALGTGISAGGVAVGTIALGGVAIGFHVAVGGQAVGPSIVDARHCDEVARKWLLEWFGKSALPPNCPR